MIRILFITYLGMLLVSCKSKSESQAESVDYLKKYDAVLAENLSKKTDKELSKGTPYRVMFTELREGDEIDSRIDVAFFLKKQKGDVDLALLVYDEHGELQFNSRNIEFLEAPSDMQSYYWEVQFILPERASRITLEQIKNFKLQMKISDKLIDLPKPEKLLRLEGVYNLDASTLDYSIVK